jgi:hypothetical protein
VSYVTYLARSLELFCPVVIPLIAIGGAGVGVGAGT